jgi:hypothetical protein
MGRCWQSLIFVNLSMAHVRYAGMVLTTTLRRPHPVVHVEGSTPLLVNANNKAFEEGADLGELLSLLDVFVPGLLERAGW